MALFKSRKGGDGSAAAARQPESIEAMRTRAKHRLIGAVVLVLIGVVGFPILFDTQPRPIAVDIPIEIPDRNKVKPLPAPAPIAHAPVASGPITTLPAPSVAAPSAPKVVEAAPPKAETKPAPKVETKPEPKIEAKGEPKPNDGAKAQALLEGKPVTPPTAADGRFVVQVGAFADPDKARETRLKVEKAGLKTYTHIAETKEGKRTRVRVGPFATRAEADKAADKIKGIDLPAAVLAL